VDRVVVHLDTKYEKAIGSESFYVAISRARVSATSTQMTEAALAIAAARSHQKDLCPGSVESVTVRNNALEPLGPSRAAHN